MMPQVGLTRKALVTQQTCERLLFGVDPSVAYELSGHAESFSTLDTLVALGLRVNASVVFEGHKVSELLLANGAEEGARLVAVFVVEQGAGVAVSASAVLTDMALFFCVSCVVSFLRYMRQRWWFLFESGAYCHAIILSCIHTRFIWTLS